MIFDDYSSLNGILTMNIWGYYIDDISDKWWLVDDELGDQELPFIYWGLFYNPRTGNPY